MKKQQTIILLIMLGAQLSMLMAQTGHVSGSVVDGRSGQKMPWVNVALMRPADTVFVRGATTDNDGHFDIRDVASGTYLVRASFMGYTTLYQLSTFTFQGSNQESLGTLTMTPGQALEKVVVSTTKPLFAMDGEKNLYNTKEDPSIQTGTASDALQNAPGVEVDAEGNITLRGVSSVEIWINDRPSHMNEEALKQYIKQMPANAIERIEVITNPSARYSSSGGVINIITNQKVTRNELLCLGVRANTVPSVSPWISYVWANEKVDFNIYLNGMYGNNDMASDGTTTLFDANGDTSRFMKYDNKNNMPYQGGYLGFNTNWVIDSVRTLSAWAGFYPYWDQNSFYNDYQYYEYNPTRVDLGYRDTTLNHGFSHGAYGGAWYEHRYDTTGRKLSITFSGNYWANSGYSDDTRDYYSPTLTDFKRHMTGSMWNASGELGVNYTLPLKKGFELELGGEFGFGYTSNDDKFDSLLPSGQWDPMPYRSYASQGLDLEPALYVTAQKRWGGFTTKLGLRFEDEIDNGWIEHHTLGDKMDFDKSFPGLVPSIHLSYQTKTFESYSISYTRRFSNYSAMSGYVPFRIYDDYSFSTGNPNLLMSYSHNLEAAFNKYIMKFGNVGLKAYWRANTDEIGTMTAATYDPVIGPYMVNYTYPVNIGSSHTEGVEANITYRPKAFFNVRFNASLFNYGYNYEDFSDSRLSYSFRLNVWAKVWNKLELFANGSYSSPRLGLYSLTNANKSLDFGCSSDFFDRKLSLYINVRDIFGWSEWGSNTTAPQYQTTGSNRYKSRFVGLGVTWRIGKMELESKARQGGADAMGSR
ncbi:MAG: TonB-dependent receptor family protein [Bacteroidales bacterium]|nr:TonB-dependent receptor family protein [Bacteroidales bacterium]